MGQAAHRILRLLLGCALGVLIAEGGLRLAGISYPEFWQWDSTLGVVLRPNAQGWSRDEGSAYVRINSDGMHDREHATAKPANTLRIAVLGDSMSEALQVPIENNFCSILEKEKELGQNIEVLNFGVSGYGTAQELLTLRNKVWKYNPDIILLAFFAANDIINNWPTLERNQATPFFVYRDSNLMLDTSFRDNRDWRDILLDTYRKTKVYSRLLQLVGRVRTDLKRPKLMENWMNELGLDPRMYQKPTEDAWKNAWNVTEGIISLMHQEVQAKGARFLIVTLSTGMQVHPNAKIRKEFLKALEVSDLFYADRRIKALGDKEGFPVLNLAPIMADYAQERGVFLHGFPNSRFGKGDAGLGRGHWNKEGHSLAGRLIAEAIGKEWPDFASNHTGGETGSPESNFSATSCE
jgi:lysophospholipase L1-like esterase